MHTLFKLYVKDAFCAGAPPPILMGLDDEISQAITNFTQHADIRGIFVVGDDSRFAGVLTRTDLLDWARVKLGAVFLQPLVDSGKTLRLANLINASKVRDILRPDTNMATILADDTLAQALRVMIEADLIVLPVTDASQRIIGSLALSELLNAVLAEDNG